MKVLSTNIGTPKTHQFNGQSIQTSMERSPTSFLEVNYDQVRGDQFTSPQLHGTPYSVVYALSSNDYVAWQKIMGHPLKWGMFGENLTLDEMDERDFWIDDIYEIGETHLQVTGPRYPCSRLNFVFKTQDMRERFRDFGKPGVYFRVLKPGKISVGDQVKILNKGNFKVSVSDVFQALRSAELKLEAPQNLNEILALPSLLSHWRERIERTYHST